MAYEAEKTFSSTQKDRARVEFQCGSFLKPSRQLWMLQESTRGIPQYAHRPGRSDIALSMEGTQQRRGQKWRPDPNHFLEVDPLLDIPQRPAPLNDRDVDDHVVRSQPLKDMCFVKFGPKITQPVCAVGMLSNLDLGVAPQFNERKVQSVFCHLPSTRADLKIWNSIVANARTICVKAVALAIEQKATLFARPSYTIRPRYALNPFDFNRLQ